MRPTRGEGHKCLPLLPPPTLALHLLWFTLGLAPAVCFFSLDISFSLSRCSWSSAQINTKSEKKMETGFSAPRRAVFLFPAVFFVFVLFCSAERTQTSAWIRPLVCRCFRLGHRFFFLLSLLFHLFCAVFAGWGPFLY